MGFGIRDSGFRIRDSGFGNRKSGFEIQDSGSGIRVSGFGIRDSGCNPYARPSRKMALDTFRRVHSFVIRDSVFGIRYSGFRIQDSGSGFRFSVFGIRVSTHTRARAERGPWGTFRSSMSRVESLSWNRHSSASRDCSAFRVLEGVQS